MLDDPRYAAGNGPRDDDEKPRAARERANDQVAFVSCHRPAKAPWRVMSEETALEPGRESCLAFGHDQGLSLPLLEDQRVLSEETGLLAST